MKAQAMLEFRRVNYRNGLYTWQPIFGLGVQTTETGCKVSTIGNHVRVWVEDYR